MLICPPPSTPYIAACAGEASGDLIAAPILQSLQNLLPAPTPVWGVGGEKMQAQGLILAHSYHPLAVRGYVEVLSHIPSILQLRHNLLKDMDKHHPKLFLGIDAPDFNLGLERKLHSKGIKTVHLVSPSIWAWRGSRIHGIKKSVDLMLCLFPFEPAIYEKAGIRAVFVGHPLAEQIAHQVDTQMARQNIGLSTTQAQNPVIAVLPGSRFSEIKHLASVFFDTITLMAKRYPNSQFVIPVAHEGLLPSLQNLREQHEFKEQIYLLAGKSGLAIAAADVVLVASGTATLETALYKKPMVIAYKVPWLTAQIMKRQGYLPYVGLPNILSERFVVPELLQDDCTPENLCHALSDWLDHPEKCLALNQHFNNMHDALHQPTGQIAAQATANILAT